MNKYVYVLTLVRINDWETVEDRMVADEDKDMAKYRFDQWVEEAKKDAADLGFDNENCDLPNHYESGYEGDYAKGSICVKLRKVQVYQRGSKI